jgi:hypothetical protein
MMNAGEQVWFTAPHNVNQEDHGLVPGQVVAAVVTEVGIQGPHWHTVEYDGGREISAADAELSHRTAAAAVAAPIPAHTYWANYERCLNRVAAQARTVDALIAILNEHYQPSCGEAFFPDGADRDLRTTLVECGWRVRWSRADYWYAICEPEGNNGITFTEGDIDRGVAIHQHFGYWINRDLAQARCYSCQFQFAGDDSSAEDWDR